MGPTGGTQRPTWRWTWMVTLCLGLVLEQTPLVVCASLGGARENMQRLQLVKNALHHLEAMVDNLEDGMERQLADEIPLTQSRHQSWHPHDDNDDDNITPQAAFIDSEDEGNMVDKRSWSQSNPSDEKLDEYNYLKRNPSSGFSAVRGKRPAADDISYKRGPPQGFSSVRGKRYYSDLSGKRAPPGGFSSVRGKRQHQKYGNPFFRLVLHDADEPPKRTPPAGFSSVRGKKSSVQYAHGDRRESRKDLPKQDYYQYMVSRLLTGIHH